MQSDLKKENKHTCHAHDYVAVSGNTNKQQAAIKFAV